MYSILLSLRKITKYLTLNSKTVVKRSITYFCCWYFKAVFITKISLNLHCSLTLAYTLSPSMEKGQFLLNFINLSIKV